MYEHNSIIGHLLCTWTSCVIVGSPLKFWPTVLDAMAENLPTPITVALNSCFFFPHSTMQSHPALTLSTGMFNYWHQGKVVFLSEIDNTVCRFDCKKKTISCWHLHRAWLSTPSIHFGGQERVCVHTSDTRSFCHGKGTFNCAVTLHIQFVLHTFRGWLWSGMDPIEWLSAMIWI